MFLQRAERVREVETRLGDETRTSPSPADFPAMRAESAHAPERSAN
jgi:hypothetical protein